MNRVTDHLFDILIREFGMWAITTLSAAITYVVSGFWRWVVTEYPSRIPEAALPTMTGNHDDVFGRLAAQMSQAGSMMLFISIAFSLIWIFVVRIHRPTTPMQAAKFRRIWFVIAALLVAATVGFYTFVLYLAPPELVNFSQIRAMNVSYKLGLFGLLLASALSSLYLMSVLRSPPTVIAAVPCGSVFARLRWR